MVTPHDIQQWIKASFTDAEVTVEGDGTHFEAVVISKQFAGKNLLARHRMVYEALGDKMRADIHALSLKAFTPDEKR